MQSAPRHHCHFLAFPFEGMHCTHVESERHFSRHSHACYGFGVVEQGAQRSVSGRGNVDSKAGDVITTNPGEVHDGHPLGGVSRRWRMVYVEPDQMASLGGASGADVEFVRPVIADAALARSIRRLLDRVEAWNRVGTSADETSLACEEALALASTRLLARHAIAGKQAEVACNVRRARDRLADDLLQAPTLTELAAQAGLSRFQLLRCFQKQYGLPPHAWLRLRRAECAHGLIAGGSSLVQAAASSGFADQSHMTRVFSQTYGYTPGALSASRSNRAGDASVPQ